MKSLKDYINEEIELDIDTVFETQKMYKVPLYEVKDVYNMLRQHLDDGYIVISGCIDISRRHLNDIEQIAKELGVSLNDLYIDKEIDKTDYYKRLLKTIEQCKDKSLKDKIQRKANKLLQDNNHDNKEASNKLKNTLKEDKFSFTPTGGGYKENGVNVLETSFIVYVDKVDKQNNKSYKCSFDELIDYAKKLCKEFDQECFSVQFPKNGKRVWMDEKGDTIREFNGIVYNDNDQPFFTTMARVSKVKDKGFFTPSRSQKFSFVESMYFYEFPCDYHYRYIRKTDGIIDF